MKIDPHNGIGFDPFALGLILGPQLARSRCGPTRPSGLARSLDDGLDRACQAAVMASARSGGTPLGLANKRVEALLYRSPKTWPWGLFAVGGSSADWHF